MKTPLTLLVLLAMTTTSAHAASSSPADPFLWLEDVTGEKSLDWVKQQNAVTSGELAGTPEFKALQSRFLTILDSKDRIPGVQKIGERYYNFWRDKDHVRGIWRRTTLDEYRKAEPAWETVLDVDALGAAEHESWVWEGASVLRPDLDRCLVSLSRGGADAQVVREFDLATKQFVAGGWSLPESKSDVGWIDRDHLYLGPAFDSTSMTTSGYPRIVKVWTRGTPLESAKTIYEGEAADVASNAWHDPTPGFERDFVLRTMTFYSNRLFLNDGGTLRAIEKPDDANASAWHEWILFELRTPWTVKGQTWPAGALLAAKFADWMSGTQDLQAVFTPTATRSLQGWATTKNALLVNVLDNVRSRILVARPGTTWSSEPLAGLPEFGTIGASGVDPYTSDDYWLSTTDFLSPSTLSLGTLGAGAATPLKHTPAFFDASRDEVTQHFATSKDGTKIPYFQVAPKGLALDGRAPTLLTGYGGFEVSELPYYSGVQGSGWLERGGVLVVANIRGGGEFGPEWHNQAIKANRMRCYEDFSSVARDLATRKVTSPAHLGCLGGSNGGLLVGNMLTLYPQLFGAVVCQAPLLDMRRYHKLLAGASWMGEYGDPDQPDQWSYIQTWSPYQNAKKDAKYPRTLFTSSTRDDRVHPGHARKMVAKLESQGHDVLYYENIEGGHGGAADNVQQAYMSALAYTFLWKQLGGAPW